MLYFKLANIIHMHILTDSYHTLQSKSNFFCNGNHVISSIREDFFYFEELSYPLPLLGSSLNPGCHQ